MKNFLGKLKESSITTILLSQLVMVGFILFWVGLLAYANHLDSTKKVITPPQANIDPCGVLEQDCIDTRNILSWTNLDRSSNKLPLLTESKLLDNAAMDQCLDMVKYGYFAHTNPATGQYYTAFMQNYEDVSNLYTGENLLDLITPHTSAEIVSDWYFEVGSQGDNEHRANMLNPNYKVMGFAICAPQTLDHHYFIQLFSS